jgi:hypothetical protein
MEPSEEIRSRIAELRLRAEPGAWREAGFEVGEDDVSLIGTVPVQLGAEAHGWTLDGPAAGEFDGLPTELGAAPGDDAAPADSHQIGAVAIDHVVVFTPSLERTISSFEGSGIRCRRVREVGPPERRLRQGFFRLGEVIAEVVEVPAAQAGPGGAARFWGLTVTVADLEGAVADLGPLCGSIRDAVQPGRRIATIKREAGLGLPVALITPDAKHPVGEPGTEPEVADAAAGDPRLPPVERRG